MKRRSRVVALVLALSMVLPWATPAHAESTDEVIFEQVDNDEVRTSIVEEVETQEPVALFSDDEIVRVAILLDGNSLVEQGFSPNSMENSRAAQNYQNQITKQQQVVTQSIERAIGEELDVQWNLTMLTNLISANVEYGQIETIEKIPGVAQVSLETVFLPAVVESQETEITQNMALSGGMIDVDAGWKSGYTGVGERIAIIDSGLDTDHQSFSEQGFVKSLSEYLRKNGQATNAYDTLGLLDKEELAEKYTKLNACKNGAAAIQQSSNLYISMKIPFGFNYFARSLDVTHDKDNSGNHGSHVAGIAAANRYLPDGKNALDEVWTIGVAPDAQILVMKVFGQDGSAYESDIYAAIEDAVALECDTVNLSLGTSLPANSDIGTFQSVMENVKNTGTTVVVSAGNNSDWAYFTESRNYLSSGHLYADDVSTNTIGTPGSATNAMTVASVENNGAISSGSMQLDGKLISFNTSNQGSAQTLRTFPSLDTSADGTGTEYEYIFVERYGQEGDFDDLPMEGKIVLVSRGMQINFGIKAERAAAAGAEAIIIYNNVDGSINMNLEGYTYDNPCVSMTLAEALKFKSAGTEHTSSKGDKYYTGTVKLVRNREIVPGDNEYMTMSSFSSWGTTGDLAIKPEITAPGGKIYSVNGGTSTGAATDRYTLMSGTSMAAPHIAGISTLINEYIEEHGYQGEFANSLRGLSQSLLMSTAVPIVEGNNEDGVYYYPILQQGAGLANVAAATSADSYIKMDSDATASYDDGKVVAELGDDPDRSGVYSFSFEIHNLDGQEHIYNLRADVFTQDHFEAQASSEGTYTTEYMSKSTVMLDAETTFLWNGDAVEAVSVPADGVAYVDVVITLTESAKKEYLEEYFKKGAYIQAYVFAEGQPDLEGKEGTTHSIPMLAFYGSWTEPSMFWGTSSYEGEMTENYSTKMTTDFSREDYFNFTYYEDNPNTGAPLITYQPENAFVISNNGFSYKLGGNPLVADNVYMPERNAVSDSFVLASGEFNLSRNATQSLIQAVCLDTQEEYYSITKRESYQGAARNNYTQVYGLYTVSPNARITDLQEGETIELSAVFLPEYYDEDKRGADEAYGDGAKASVTAVVDTILPQISEISLDGNTLAVSAADNRYIAAVALYSASGDQVISYAGAKQQIEAGEEAVYELNYSGQKDNQFLLQVYDYALNMATYRVTVKQESLVFSGAMVVFDQDEGKWALCGEDAKALENLSGADETYNAATAIGDMVFAVTNEGSLYVLDALNLSSKRFVDQYEQVIVDLAYSPADEVIYGVTDESEFIRIDPVTGLLEVLGDTPFETNTLGCDSNGTFYSNRYGTGEIYRYTLNTIQSESSLDYDFTGEGAVTLADAQMLLDYVTGKENRITNGDCADIDEDGDVDTYDVYLMNQAIPYLPELLAVAYTTNSKYLQAMEVDHGNGKLYWASYSTDLMQGEEIGFSYMWSVDLETEEIERHADFWDQLTAMVIYDKDVSRNIAPVDGVVRLNISNKEKTMAVGEVTGLAAGVSPWNVDQPGIIWMSSDEQVATVDEYGNITAVAEGECQIIATSVMDDTVSAVCEIIVVADVREEQTEPVSEMASINKTEQSAKKENDDKLVNIVLELTAQETLTNGLRTVSIDSTDMTLISIEGAELISSVQREGLLTVGYVHNTPVDQGDTVISLTFQATGCGSERVALVRELQQNNKHLEQMEVYELSTHSWSEWTTEKEATCMEDGTMTRICPDCGEKEEQVLTAAGMHGETVRKGEKAETCTETGYSGDMYCKECGELIAEGYEIPVKAHTYVDGICSCGAEDPDYVKPTENPEDPTEPEETKPTKPEETKPTEPGETKPTEPEETRPTEPEETKPTEPEETEPTEPEETQPTEPEETQPTEPEETEPTEPAEPEIVVTEKYKDVKETDWFVEAVDFVVNKGLMNGMSENEFAPNEATTRAQIAMILYRMEGEPSVDGMENPFSDVKVGDWYFEAVVWAADAGVVKGMTETTFEPDTMVTREQMVTMMHRYIGEPEGAEGAHDGFKDADKVSDWAEDAMAWAVENGIITGFEDNTVRPTGNSTRAQIATVLMRYVEM